MPNAPSVHIKSARCFPGATAGLADKTALVSLTLEGPLGDWPAVESRLRAAAPRLRPAAPSWGVVDHDWPHAFVSSAGEPTSWAHWAAALTIACQRWAGDPVGQGRVLGAVPPAMSLAIPWDREAVFQSALSFALRHLLLWMAPAPDPEAATHLAQGFESWLAVAQAGGLAPNTLRFAEAARRRDIPVSVTLQTLTLGWGCHAERLDSSFTGHTSTLAARFAQNKIQTSQLLHAALVPVPATAQVSTWQAALKVSQQLGWPVVIKPGNQEQGRGVIPGIQNEVLLRQAFEAASRLSPRGVIIEKHVEGNDHRMLVVGGTLRITALRIPAGVTGNGADSVRQRVDQANSDPRRGTGKRSLMMALALDDEALACLSEQGLTPESTPEDGRFIRLRRTANLSQGGTAVDVTPTVHPDNRIVAERAARIIGLDIAGVDFLCPDISRSWREVGGAVCEVNAQPGFRPHWLSDPSRDINGEIIDWLFRDKAARIPTVAVTGTNGKSTVCRMLHHIWMTAGKKVGTCTTHGVWIGEDRISDQNLSGQPGGRMLLNDPAVEAAVIEMPRKGLLKFGQPCDRYDVAAILNVQDDHIGVDGIDTLEAMARLKAEVLERASRAVVINAEDPLCLALREHVRAPLQILVARRAEAPALRTHLDQGGAGVFAQMHLGQPWVVLAEGALHTPLMPLADIPATMHGLLGLNEINALFAVALAWSQRIEAVTIIRALASFANDPQHNPGRYNIIEGFPFQVIVDFGHNPHGVQAICEIARKLPVAGRRHVVSTLIGNRHQTHLQACAPFLAAAFDAFVLSLDPDKVLHSKDYQGESPLQAMLARFVNALEHEGVRNGAIVVQTDRLQAIRYGLTHAQRGDLVVILADPNIALPLVSEVLKGPLKG